MNRCVHLKHHPSSKQTFTRSEYFSEMNGKTDRNIDMSIHKYVDSYRKSGEISINFNATTPLNTVSLTAYKTSSYSRLATWGCYCKHQYHVAHLTFATTVTKCVVDFSKSRVSPCLMRSTPLCRSIPNFPFASEL